MCRKNNNSSYPHHKIRPPILGINYGPIYFHTALMTLESGEKKSWRRYSPDGIIGLRRWKKIVWCVRIALMRLKRQFGNILRLKDTIFEGFNCRIFWRPAFTGMYGADITVPNWTSNRISSLLVSVFCCACVMDHSTFLLVTSTKWAQTKRCST